jgi:hypothetical protein
MPALLRPSLFLLLVAGCVPLGGSQDGGGCDITCPPTFEVGFLRDGAWPAATYRVDVTADGTSNSCEIVIPLTCDVPPRCQGSPSWRPILVGCSLDPAQHKIGGIAFDLVAPSRVVVEVWQGERHLGGGIFGPSYRTMTAPACNISCSRASDDGIVLAP